MVQWIIGVWLDEQEDQSQNDRVHSENRFPVFPQDIETDVPLQVDVRVVDWREAQALGSSEWVVVSNINGEFVLATLPNALLLICEVDD